MLNSGRPSRTAVAFVCLCLIWGASYLAIRVALLHGFTPLGLVALRLIVGALVVIGVVIARRERVRVNPGTGLTLAAVAIVNIALPFFLVAWGETRIPSALAAVLNSTIPIFSVLLAGAVLHDEPVTAFRLGGVAIGFVGIVVLFSHDVVSGVRWSYLAGEGSVLLSSVCYALGAVLNRRLLRGTPPLTTALYSVTASALVMTAASALVAPPDFGAIDLRGWLALAWLGVLGSGAAYLLAFSILASWGAARYTLVAYSLPIIGLTLGVIVLGEHLDAREVIGSALVVGGIVLASRMSRRGAPATPTQAGELRGVTQPPE